MKCDKCREVIKNGDQRGHFGQVLCEDCYIDAIFKVKACDPWAVHSAKMYEKHAGGEIKFTNVQERILRLLKDNGSMRPSSLLDKLGGNLQLEDLEIEFASLRHMQKGRAYKKDQKVYWRLW
jgi:hypothetical protein